MLTREDRDEINEISGNVRDMLTGMVRRLDDTLVKIEEKLDKSNEHVTAIRIELAAFQSRSDAELKAVKADVTKQASFFAVLGSGVLNWAMRLLG